MYDLMRNELITELDKSLLNVDLENEIMRVVDKVCNKYNISKKETALVPYQFEYPKELTAYIHCKKVEGTSKGYIDNVRYAVQNLVMYYQKPISQITTNDVRVYMDMYKELNNTSPRTLDKYRQYYATFFDWCVGEEYINKNPMTKIQHVKYPKTKRKHLTPKQLELLFSVCENDMESALVALLFSSACRGQEIANLKLKDIDWKLNEFTVIGKGNKQRTCYISSRAEILLTQYLNSKTDNSEYVFSHNGKQYTRDALGRRFVKIYKRIEDKIPFKITLHIIRHTTATMLLKSGMPINEVSKYLGHSQISTTQIYADTDDSDVKTSFMKLMN